MAVKFLCDANVGAHYNKGEIAGFEAAVEASLIKQKIAEPYNAKEQAKQANEPAAAKQPEQK